MLVAFIVESTNIGLFVFPVWENHRRKIGDCMHNAVGEIQAASIHFGPSIKGLMIEGLKKDLKVSE